MSFSQQIKLDICSERLQSSCCRKAMLMGLVTARGCTHEKKVGIRIASHQAIDYVSQLIFEMYGKQPEIIKEAGVGRSTTLLFSSSDIHDAIERLDDGAYEPLFHEKCNNCASSFMRGLFLACGRICDPIKQYLLEFSVENRADAVESFLWTCQLHPKYANRKNEQLLQLRDSTSLEEFFVLLGINKYAFTIMNARIEKDMKRDIQRATNCETGNISRTVSATTKQIELIEQLQARGLISSLPEELQETAKLRLAHSDLSLSSLAACMVPPITKSGLTHRLKRLVAIAEQLLEDS